MKKLTMLLSGTMFLVLLLSVSAFKPLPPGPSANGQGSLTLAGDQQRRFSFHANTMPDGSVKGSAVITYTGGVLKDKLDINCMTVTGNQAEMSGIITDATNPALIGTGFYFRVRDNGEGTNTAADEITLVFVNLAPGFPCVGGHGILQPIEGGNIQVKP